jgi:hypothetical protein
MCKNFEFSKKVWSDVKNFWKFFQNVFQNGFRTSLQNNVVSF